ncbi:alpha/beta hydrolase [Ligilactobacillus ruminis]|uniref:Alpha/beta hydrolase n=1 Tax=Ligilactobacillus ruminis TaxID=1623 RepID=A0AAQ3AUK0_9LACO|nr:alpha/beta hydrolase [Ligilactobacillus ruminis]KLA44052.1 endo-1,4-beta-xylanase [Ligilactobacillus ruminis]MCI5767418.1 alpha/beta hydrolase [Ligilactobacillus ruminis]WDC79915.1 alpha/beta hydrolase [Ligilactobacillus ruminis]WDC82920.1 alpha/beta hydrolase [Ligilactobacillus ruminis]
MRYFEHKLKTPLTSDARLICYIPDNSEEIEPHRKRRAIIICPGGSYAKTSDREAEPIALELLSMDCAVCILRYSCAPRRFPKALCELAQSVLFLKENAERFNIDEGKILVMGFSAGGHLAACLGIIPDELEKLGYDEKLIRPAGMILCYPVITSGRYWHQGSFENLLGDELMERSSAFSLEKRVNDKTPKAFIWQTFADRTVPVQNSLLLAEALSENAIPFELHVYPKGKHGLGLGTKISAKNETYVEKDVQSWVFLLKRWLEDSFPNTSIFNQNG